MLTTDTIMDALREILDPEMPINIVDLGIVNDVRVEDGRVDVDILPTFVGCPALPMIENDIRVRLGSMDGVREIDVSFVFDPPWTVDRITTAGRASLREHGVTVPETGGRGATTAEAMVTLRTSAIPCPFCGSSDTRLDSPFGPTRCRMIYYCDGCRNAFEHMKRL